MKGSLAKLLIFFQPKKKKMVVGEECSGHRLLNIKKTKSHSAKPGEDSGNLPQDKIHDGNIVTS